MDAGNKNMTRRALVASAGAVLLAPAALATQGQEPVKQNKPVKPKPPALEPALVKKFVGAAHGNLDLTREMLAATPGLLNATWDWGGGDFESALEGAGHMGRADIAHFLLEKGARMNIFCAAMLGHLDFVKAAIDAYPGLINSKGAHGIGLVQHAKAGEERSKHVLEWLEKHS